MISVNEEQNPSVVSSESRPALDEWPKRIGAPLGLSEWECSDGATFYDSKFAKSYQIGLNKKVTTGGASPALATYPEMNRQIVSLLRLGGSALSLYAAARIEELEDALSILLNNLPVFPDTDDPRSHITATDLGLLTVGQINAARAALKEKGSESQ
jgi:hypothetical protein